VYNVVGGLLWVWSTVLLGYFLGRAVPSIERYIHVVIVVVIALSLLPAVIELYRARVRRSNPGA
jgi:membrane-associated protein